MAEQFWEDMQSSDERTNFYTTEIKESDWRILLTCWAGNSWERFKNKTSLIKKSAKRMCLWNCRCGCKNHLIKVRKIQYEPPKEDDPKIEPLTQKQASQFIYHSMSETNNFFLLHNTFTYVSFHWEINLHCIALICRLGTPKNSPWFF